MGRQEIKKACPVCHGSGKPTGDKSVGEILSGYCYKCHGSGQITDYIDIPEQRTSTTSSSSGSGDDKAILGLILLAIAIVVIIYVVFFAIVFAPIIYSGLLLFSGWEKHSIWNKIGWIASWFIVFSLFTPEFYILTDYINDFPWAWGLVSTYTYLGFIALTIVIVEQGINSYQAGGKQK